MPRRNRPVLSLKGGRSAPTTARTEPDQAAPNEPSQERVMEALAESTQAALTAKQMAAAEETNAARLVALKRREAEEAEAASQEPVSIIGLAAQGREVLLEQLRQHAERAKPKEYVPPPRTARQMSQLEEELEAGRRAQVRAQAQHDSRPVPKVDLVKDGYTTPVYRPADLVPDPTMPSATGSAAGSRVYGADAP